MFIPPLPRLVLIVFPNLRASALHRLVHRFALLFRPAPPRLVSRLVFSPPGGDVLPTHTDFAPIDGIEGIGQALAEGGEHPT
jgi:hypothetical protein